MVMLDIDNDELLCKVFPTSFQGTAPAWFHQLPPNSIHSFREMLEVFVAHYLCSTRQKLNISSFQNLKKTESETLHQFMHKFNQAMLQVEMCSMDALLQAFKCSIGLGTFFFESLSKKPLEAVDDLFRRANKYAMLEEDLQVETSPVLASTQIAQARKDAGNKRKGLGNPS